MGPAANRAVESGAPIPAGAPGFTPDSCDGQPGNGPTEPSGRRSFAQTRLD